MFDTCYSFTVGGSHKFASVICVIRFSNLSNTPIFNKVDPRHGFLKNKRIKEVKDTPSVQGKEEEFRKEAVQKYRRADLA